MSERIRETKAKLLDVIENLNLQIENRNKKLKERDEALKDQQEEITSRQCVIDSLIAEKNELLGVISKIEQTVRTTAAIRFPELSLYDTDQQVYHNGRYVDLKIVEQDCEEFRLIKYILRMCEDK